MSDPIQLEFSSRLSASREHIWEWITSVEGISAEMRPYLGMTTPDDISNITDVDIRPGEPLFRSYILLFGFLPIDYSDLTLTEIDEGRGFIEESSMGSMKLWRHERRILDDEEADASGVRLVDRLTVRPRFAMHLVRWFLTRFFNHRHAVLREQFRV